MEGHSLPASAQVRIPLSIIFTVLRDGLFSQTSSFNPPCQDMIITITGFIDRNRDWVKDMIQMSGAKYTGYFTRHNHVIVCQK